MRNVRYLSVLFALAAWPLVGCATDPVVDASGGGGRPSQESGGGGRPSQESGAGGSQSPGSGGGGSAAGQPAADAGDMPVDAAAGESDCPGIVVSAQEAQFEAEVLALTNEKRAQSQTCGSTPRAPVPPLKLDAHLQCAARRHAADMAAHHLTGHTGSDGSTPEQRIVAAGYSPWHAWGENVADGYATPAAVVEAWMKSPGHCLNIMAAGFADIGVGYAYDEHAAAGAPKSYWTQDFGRK